MLIGMRNGMMSGSKPTARSYVQDGLIAMWDGIENAGWGVHDPNATVWMDLSDGVSTPVEYGSFRDDCFASYIGEYYSEDVCSLRSSKAKLLSAIAAKSITVEIVLNLITGSGRRGVFGSPIKSDFIKTLGVYNINASLAWLCWGGSYRRPIPVFQERDAWSFPCNGNFSRFYRNGIYVAQNSQGTSRNIEADFCLNSIGTNGGELKIDYHCVRAYSRALTAEEVAANYAIDKARFNLP